MTTSKPAVRAPKPNVQERAQRQTAIDALLQRALRGQLTIPEAAVLAEYWRAEQRIGEKTRRRLTDTTRSLQRHREAADAEIRRLEQRIDQLLAAGQGPAHDSGPSVQECAANDRNWPLEREGE